MSHNEGHLDSLFNLSPGITATELSMSPRYKQVDSPYEMVKDFHQSFNLPVLDKPELPEKLNSIDFRDIIYKLSTELEWAEVRLKEIDAKGNQRLVRMRLLIEEFAEYVNAEIDDDIVEVADSLGDMQYIINGTALVYGIPLDDVYKDIHNNNMSKLGPDGKPVIVNGKVQKPADYQPVNLSKYFIREE